MPYSKMSLLFFTQIFCSISFLAYGSCCLMTQHMKREFQRYGIPRYRTVTGILQICAALGLVLGLWFPFIGGIAAAGLALQMASGLYVRITIHDSLLQSSPAAGYMLLCAWMAAQLL